MADTPQTKSAVALAEEKILAFWRSHDIFQKSLRARAGAERFIFYDGPPFATGTPHYGHILASAIKDAVPRYQTMRGRLVPRRWGWDTHGLPIENIVEKQLGLSGKQQIEALGVDTFNHTARAQVLTYVDEWKKTVERIARWVDFDGSYKTMDNNYIESVWWAFGQLYDKGLVYEGTRVLPYCPRCETPVAQSEIAMDNSYKEISDLSVYVKFPLKHGQGPSLLAWTTTPWTLPGNTALAVHPELTYVEVAYATPLQIEHLILAKDRLIVLGPATGGVSGSDSWKIVRELSAAELIGQTYQPPFAYFLAKDLPNQAQGWRVVAAPFVSQETGSGIVHIAPAFGEEDMALAQQAGLPVIQHVGPDGCFSADVADFPGWPVKPKDNHQRTDVAIIKHLAAAGQLFKKEKIVHPYPHCFRCETPLYYSAIPAWFVKIQAAKPRLAELNESIHWVPAHLKHGRFLKSMAGAPDWNISRTRFWASPLPIWKCAAGHVTVVDSVQKLKDLAGAAPADLHRPFIDRVVFVCPTCGEAAHRIPEVFDCWFESGSMPFAAVHYPFENTDWFQANFPGDFVAEYIAQTRTWFYYMHVLATLLFDAAPFRHVVTTGNILAEDGQKMSKRLRNYPDPAALLNTSGADALRFYLLASPVLRSEDINFSAVGVDEVAKKILLRLRNVAAFYLLYPTVEIERVRPAATHSLDRWMLARLDQVMQAVTAGMDRYEIDAALRPFDALIDDLSVWYVRRSRDRLRAAAGGLPAQTLRYVLGELAKLLAPFTPFIAEELFSQVKGAGEPESVHLADWPTSSPAAADLPLLDQMVELRQLVSLGLEARHAAAIKVRQPLAAATVVGRAALPVELVEVFRDELNVKTVRWEQGGAVRVELDTWLTPALKREGELREIVRAVQALRKEAGLTMGAAAQVLWSTDAPEIAQLLADPSLATALPTSTFNKVADRSTFQPIQLAGNLLYLQINQ